MENKVKMGIKHKSDKDFNINYPRIVDGSVAEEFQNYLAVQDAGNKIRFSFLIIAQFVLESKDPELFNHLASVFLDRQSQYNIKLSNEYAQDELFSFYPITENKVGQEIVDFLKENGKEDWDIWGSPTRGLNHMFDMFKEERKQKIAKLSNIDACILSIL